MVRLARAIDWQFLDDRFSSVSTLHPWQPGLPTRLFILRHMRNLADEGDSTMQKGTRTFTIKI